MSGGTTVPASPDDRDPPPYIDSAIWEGAARADDTDDVFPTWLDGFRRDVALGKGGMGVVYRYRDTRLDRLVAVKTIPATLGLNRDRRRRFELEARTLAALDHPNIGRIHQLLERDGRTYLVLEYVPGHTLQELLREAPLSVERTLEVGTQIALAIEAGHRKSIAHRDIKPGNIMVTPGMVTKLLDYGLACYNAPGGSSSDPAATVAIADSHDTEPGRVMGTPGYMSPEQARGEVSAEPADVWALGCVLYECLTARASFTGVTRRERTHATLEGEPDWSRLPTTTPPALRHLIERCLFKDPAARPPRMEDVSAELNGLRSRGRSRADVGPVPNNLPTERTPFIGRGEATAEVGALLTDARMLTLTGTGGAGKTRLSLHYARRSLKSHDGTETPYPDGVFVVELTGVTDPGQVAAAVLAGLPGRSESPQPAEVQPIDLLVERVASRRLLLVIDNCEHVVLPCAELCSVLLMSCPHLRILATSREALGIDGEQLFNVGGLPYPESEGSSAAIDASEAVRLFESCARRVRARFTVDDATRSDVAAICRRVEGIPLAIELAAARVRSMPLRAIRQRLLDVVDPDRVLESSIAWSVQQLSGPPRELLGRLAVFHGGWTLESAEEVCGDGPGGAVDGALVIELLARLVEKSLVVYEERGDRARYHLLVMVEEYVRSHVQTAEQHETIEPRHTSFYERLAAAAGEHLDDHEQAVWFDRLQREQSNLQAALDRLGTSEPDCDRAVRMALALYTFWCVRHEQLDSGRSLLARLLAQRGEVSDLLQMRAFNALGTMASQQNEVAEAEDYYLRAAQIATDTGDRRRLAGLLTNLGLLATRSARTAEARRHHERAIGLYVELGEATGVAMAQLNLADTALFDGGLEEAERLLCECLPEFHRQGDERRIAVAELNLARIRCRSGRADDAISHARTSTALSIRHGNRPDIARGTLWLGIGYQMVGDDQRAADLLSTAEAMHEALGMEIYEGDAKDYRQALDILRRSLDPERPGGGSSSGSRSFDSLAAGVRVALRENPDSTGEGP